ncbi:MAG: transglutaminase-like domain-containing protein [Firmicutes bacterium]|nr:transglutaminase-like domain-containing protein [Bacillota bacterium]
MDVSSGRLMKIWSPFPIANDSQHGIKLISSSPPCNYISPPQSDLGVIYFEIENDGCNPEFEVKYTFSFVSHDMYFNLDPAEIQPFDNKDPLLKPYLKSEKHITISDDLKNLAYSIVKDEKNPLARAMMIYVWMTDNLIYSFLPHEIIEDESEYVLRTRKGDCGAQSIFYAALCRALGIPARVSGGWHLGPGFRLNHLWTEIYIPPYGWVPVDSSEALHQIGGGDFDEKDWPKLLKLFFGVFNRYHVCIHNNINLPLIPPKTSERSFDYAFHMAEKEYEDVNLPFRDSLFEVEIIKGF